VDKGLRGYYVVRVLQIGASTLFRKGTRVGAGRRELLKVVPAGTRGLTIE